VSGEKNDSQLQRLEGQIHLVPMMSKVGGDASHGPHKGQGRIFLEGGQLGSCPGASTTKKASTKKSKSENMQKRAVFYVYVIFLEQSGEAGVENGAMLTTFIQIGPYTSECTIS